MREAQLQRAVMAYLSFALPGDALAFHPPNEGKRSAIMGANLKRQGMLPGLPDVLVVWRGALYAIELKTARGSLTDRQRAVQQRLAEAGCSVGVARDLDGVEALLTQWGVPLAARRAA